MKAIIYSPTASRALLKHRNRATVISAKIERYAGTGAGDVTEMVGRPAKRLRIGDFRVIFEETDETITVIDIGPRGGIYE